MKPSKQHSGRPMSFFRAALAPAAMALLILGITAHEAAGANIFVTYPLWRVSGGPGSPETLRRLSFSSLEMRLWRVLFCGL